MSTTATFWSKYPLTRVLIAFIVGILLAFYNLIIPLNPVISLICILIGISLSIFLQKIENISGWIPAFVLIISILLAGILYTQIYIKHHEVADNICCNTTQTFTATICEAPIEKSNSVKLIVNINDIQVDSAWQPSKGKALLYLAKDSLALQTKYGDKLLIAAKLNTIDAPKNPHEFNYQRHLKVKNIYLQSYCNSTQWTTLDTHQGNPIMAFSIGLRNKFLQIFKDADMSMQEYSIIAAMLLGCDDYIDPELSKSYSSVGASHILCVSGMHIGIIYMILNFLLSFMDKKPSTKKLKSIILLLFIWLYACMTGLSPSVMRAATMFSFVAFAGLLNRKNNIYNSLLTSMTLLLIINPLNIFAVGFQFSYLAVFGIVWLNKLFYNLYTCKTKLGNYLWNIICVSLTAQISIAPLSAFYFHQFPNYFLLTNVIVITLAPFVIGLGIAVLTCSFWAPLYKLLAYCLTLLIRLMNNLVVGIDNIPYSSTKGICFSPIQTILIYIFIATLFCALLYKYKDCIFLSLSTLIVFLSLEFYNQFRVNHLNEIVIYSSRSTPIIDHFQGRNCTCYYSDCSCIKNIDFSCQGNRIYNRSKNIESYGNSHYIDFGEKNCLIIDQPIIPNDEKITVNYLILSQQLQNMETICQRFSFDTLIIDGSFSYYQREKLLSSCERLNIKYIDLSQQALILPLGKS